MSPMIKVNEKTEPQEHSYDFYVVFSGKGPTLEKAFQDAMENGNLSEIPTPETAITEHVPEAIFKELDETGLCAVNNGPIEE
jgi:hypothetical protein